MKLDATDLRYITPDEFRVLVAVCIPLLAPSHHIDTEAIVSRLMHIRTGRGRLQEPSGCADTPNSTARWPQEWGDQQASRRTRQAESHRQSAELEMCVFLGAWHASRYITDIARR